MAVGDFSSLGGELGLGGNGNNYVSWYSGGGGGYYGGGCGPYGSGGSSYYGGVENGVTLPGRKTGDGQIKITEIASSPKKPRRYSYVI